MKIILTLLLISTYFFSSAQKNAVYLAPISLAQKTFDIEYKRSFNKGFFLSLRGGSTFSFKPEYIGTLLSSEVSGDFFGVGMGVNLNLIDTTIKSNSYIGIEFIHSRQHRVDLADIDGFYGYKEFIFEDNLIDNGISVYYGQLINIYKNLKLDVSVRLMYYNINKTPLNYFYSPGFGFDLSNEGESDGVKLKIYPRLAYRF